MLSINSKFRARIKNLLKELDKIRASKTELNSKYEEMRRRVFAIKQIKLYKPVKGDVVDEMFANCLNKAKVEIDVQRISANNYMFGTKKILAKIVNGQLVIRVGGGYMNAEEFIDQYGKIEMMKIMKMEEQAKASKQSEAPGNTAFTAQAKVDTGLNRTRSSVSALGNLGMTPHELKEQMRNTLLKNFGGQDADGMNLSIKNNPLLKSKTNSKFGTTRMSLQVGSEEELKHALDGMKSKLAQTPSKMAQGRRSTVFVPMTHVVSGRNTAMSSRHMSPKAGQTGTQPRTTLASKIGGGYKTAAKADPKK